MPPSLRRHRMADIGPPATNTKPALTIEYDKAAVVTVGVGLLASHTVRACTRPVFVALEWE